MSKTKTPSRPARSRTPARASTPAAASLVVVPESVARYGRRAAEVYRGARTQMEAVGRMHLTFYYKLGRQLLALREDMARDGQADEAQTAVNQIASALEMGYQDRSAAERLAQCYPDEAAFNELVHRRGARGQSISWTALKFLVTPDLDDEARAALVDRCLNEGLGVRELWNVLQQELGTRAENRGRHPSRPRSARDAVKSLEGMTRKWLSYTSDLFADAWLETQYDEVPDDRIDPGDLNLLDGLLEQFQAIESTAELTRERLAQIREQLIAKSGLIDVEFVEIEGGGPENDAAAEDHEEEHEASGTGAEAEPAS